MTHTKTPTIRSAIAFLNGEHQRGPADATRLLARPLSTWPRDGRLGYGALDALLDAAHDDLDRDVGQAMRIVRYVLDQVPCAAIPQAWSVYRRLLRARALKEHASALLTAGEHSGASKAAQLASKAYTREGLESDAASARLLNALAMERLGKCEKATSILKGCISTFEVLGDAKRLLQARTTHAVLLYRAQEYNAAERIFRQAKMDAERLGDQCERARIWNNLAHCAIKLDHPEDAPAYFAEALRLFNGLGMSGERPRVFWGIAKLLEAAQNFAAAIMLYRGIRDEFLRRGMQIDAAEVGLSLLDLLYAAGERDQVVQVADDLATVFSRSGMQESLARATAYLVDSARSASDGELYEALQRVRAFLRQLLREPFGMFSTRSAAT